MKSITSLTLALGILSTSFTAMAANEFDTRCSLTQLGSIISPIKDKIVDAGQNDVGYWVYDNGKVIETDYSYIVEIVISLSRNYNDFDGSGALLSYFEFSKKDPTVYRIVRSAIVTCGGSASDMGIPKDYKKWNKMEPGSIAETVRKQIAKQSI